MSELIYAGKFPMATFNKKNMADIICNHKKRRVKNKNMQLILQVRS